MEQRRKRKTSVKQIIKDDLDELKETLSEEDYNRIEQVTDNFYYTRLMPSKNPSGKSRK